MLQELMQAQWSLRLLLLVCVTCVTLTLVASTDEGQGHYLNQFAVRVKRGGLQTAEEVARQYGFVVTRELPNINVFLLEHHSVQHRSKRSAVNELELLQNDERITHAQQEEILHRVKRRNMVYDKQLELPIRAIDDASYARVETLVARDNIDGVSLKYDDPKFKDMWYLVNDGQSGGEAGLDMNIAVVWQSGFTGKGVVVTILDDGIDHTHPDLIDNYDKDASADLNDKDDKQGDPMPDRTKTDNSHGTRCAGEIAAAANNNVCGVGIAYDCKIGGVRVLDGPVTDSLEAEALTINNQHIDIYSASWGPSDDGKTMDAPRPLTMEALKKGAAEGRQGLGSIFVWATGNGGVNQDDCSADGYVSQPETLSVGSVNDWGRSPFFMENCSSTLAVVPSGGEDYRNQERKTGVKLKVITTDMNGGCIENFQGTSSAAPLAAGCLANVLQANPALGWRDVQHIVIRGSRIPSADDSWTINGAGHHVSHKFGFGLFDCGKMVQLAQTWENVPEQRTCETSRKNYQILKRGQEIKDLVTVDCTGSQSIDRLEHVQVHVEMNTAARGDTKLILVSPAGTKSVLLSPRVNDVYEGSWKFTFMTVHAWDESPKGTWELIVRNVPTIMDKRSDKDNTQKRGNKDESEEAGYIKSWTMSLRGTHGTRHSRDHVAANREQKAYSPSEDDVQEIKKREVELSKRVQVKRAKIDGIEKKSSSKSKKRTYQRTEETDKVISKLWDMLHSHGEKTVRKRVLRTENEIPPVKQNLVNGKNIDSIVDNLVSVLETIIKKKRAE